MRVLISLASIFIAFCIAAIASAEDDASHSDPLLGQRLVEGAATPNNLWVRNSNGAVVQFDRLDGARRELAQNGVVDMVRSNGRLLALHTIDGEEGTFNVIDLNSQDLISPKLKLDETPTALFAEDEIIVLSKKALFRLQGREWHKTKLSKNLRSAPQISVASDSQGMIYVGYNIGEWGGGVQAIELASGRVSEVERIDEGDICGEPLDKDCDPVTGLVRDNQRPDCVLASIGLSHFLSHGRILRICNAKVEVVFSEAVPAPDDYSGPPMSNTWPFFGLASTNKGWAAVSYGRIFLSKDGVVSQTEFPKLAEWSGLELAVLEPDLIVLKTDVNWGMSLSGYTPMLVEITD